MRVQIKPHLNIYKLIHYHIYHVIKTLILSYLLCYNYITIISILHMRTLRLRKVK